MNCVVNQSLKLTAGAPIHVSDGIHRKFPCFSPSIWGSNRDSLHASTIATASFDLQVPSTSFGRGFADQREFPLCNDRQLSHPFPLHFGVL